MSEEHRDRLRINVFTFVEMMTPDVVITILQSRKVLTHADASNIKSGSAGENREKEVSALMNILRLKGERAFCEFVKALEMSEQLHLRRLLVNGKEMSFSWLISIRAVGGLHQTLLNHKRFFILGIFIDFADWNWCDDLFDLTSVSH